MYAIRSYYGLRSTMHVLLNPTLRSFLSSVGFMIFPCGCDVPPVLYTKVRASTVQILDLNRRIFKRSLYIYIYEQKSNQNFSLVLRKGNRNLNADWKTSRITSYNVCYTKLLRENIDRHPGNLFDCVHQIVGERIVIINYYYLHCRQFSS